VEDVIPVRTLDLPTIGRCLRASVARGRLVAASRQHERRLELALRASGAAIWEWDLVGGRMTYPPEWGRLVGLHAEPSVASPDAWFDRVHADDRQRVTNEVSAHLDGTTPQLVTEHRLRHEDGSYRWAQFRGVADRASGGRTLRLIGTLADVSERRSAEEQLRHGAFFDALTGLPNRAVLMDRLGRSVELAKRRGDYVFALLFSDLDGFKVINDSLGHGVGDELLVAVARRIEGCIRTVDTLARLGGDEFAILLDNIRDTHDALRVAERIHDALSTPVTLSRHEVNVSSSVGIASSIAGYDRPEEIVRDADIAMYRAKGKGKGRHEIFDESMHLQAVDRLKLESDLRRALRQDELCVHYQPIASIPTGRIVGFEALVRWEHPEQGLVSPARFIPLAEETGMIIPLDRWVLRRACQQMKCWQDRYPSDPPLTISVNLSPKQLSRPDLVDEIRGVLESTGLDPATFRPEITESVLMEDLDAASLLLERLKHMNILLHMDDFGTGYSSLSYLVRFRVDTLKIDGSFVSHMETAGESVEIVRMIVALAHNLGMQVIAEGVESEQQLAQLRRLGCEYGQGYYFSRPLPAERAEELLRAQAATPAGQNRTAAAIEK
jgi:diguanylate cyclase (GGDEF)-like protein/PAS domain S-box-containing protein